VVAQPRTEPSGHLHAPVPPSPAGPRVVRWPALDATAAVDAVVTTRHGGVSPGVYASLNLGLHVGDDPANVVANRRRAASTVGLDLANLVFCRQSHGAAVAVVGAEDRGRGTLSDSDALDATDALVTTEPDVGLVVMVADCVPIVMVDPQARVLACVHAGWRGTVAGVSGAAVATMIEHGADASRLVVGIGPAVSPQRYQVGADVHDAVMDAFGERSAGLVPPDGTGRWTFDVVAANRMALTDAGVDPANIHDTGITDTAINDTGTGTGTDATGDHYPEPGFFSDRQARPCGRFAIVARLLP
jgi:YfiH family protein